MARTKAEVAAGAAGPARRAPYRRRGARGSGEQAPGIADEIERLSLELQHLRSAVGGAGARPPRASDTPTVLGPRTSRTRMSKPRKRTAPPSASSSASKGKKPTGKQSSASKPSGWPRRQKTEKERRAEYKFEIFERWYRYYHRFDGDPDTQRILAKAAWALHRFKTTELDRRPAGERVDLVIDLAGPEAQAWADRVEAKRGRRVWRSEPGRGIHPSPGDYVGIPEDPPAWIVDAAGPDAEFGGPDTYPDTFGLEHWDPKYDFSNVGGDTQPLS